MITRGKGDFPLAPFPVVDISGGHSFCCPTLPDDSGRDTREEVAGSTGDTGASPRSQSRFQENDRQESQQETSTDVNDGQDGDVFRFPFVQKGGARITYCKITSFTVCALVFGGATSESQAKQMDVESVSSEESFSMWNVPTASQLEQDFLLEQLQSLSSSGITGQNAPKAILQMFPDQQQKITVANTVKKLQATMPKN